MNSNIDDMNSVIFYHYKSTVPDSFVESLKSVVDGLEKGTSEYRCVADAAEAAGVLQTTDDAALERHTQLSQFQVDEFKRILDA